MSERAWRWYVALDGGDLDGLVGDAGLMRFDWPSQEVTHRFYDGISSAHNVSTSPGRKHLLLGNFSQQIVLVDPETLEERERFSTMSLEPCDYRLRSPTHYLWFDDRYFLCAVGPNMYRFDAEDLAHPENIGAHGMLNPHELRWSPDHRWVLMGDLGTEQEAPMCVGVFDLQERRATQIKLPETVWHVVAHPTKPLGYAVTYSFSSDEGNRIDWAPSFVREYVVEVDLPAQKITRSWSAGADFPIHLNSDLEVYSAGKEERLYVSSGGSHTVVELDLGDFSSTRTVTVVPSFWVRFWSWRQRMRNILGGFARKSFFVNSHFALQTLMVTGWRSFDGVYAARVSPDGRYLVAGSRGYNYVRVMDRRSLETVAERQLPTHNGLHLGMHHSELIAVD